MSSLVSLRFLMLFLTSTLSVAEPDSENTVLPGEEIIARVQQLGLGSPTSIPPGATRPAALTSAW